MKNVILVQPKVGFVEDLVYKRTLPLALLMLSAFIVRKYNIVLIDQRFDKDWKKSLEKELNKNPICVGTTSMTGPQIKHALEVSKFVKANSDVPVVWGGIHATLLPQQTVKNPYVDIVVKGEGDLTFYELVNCLENGTPLENVKGIVYKESGKIRSNPEREFLDLDQLPMLPYELINLKKFLVRFKGKPTFFMQTSRGCPYRCKFCFNPYYNRGEWRAQSAEKVLDRLESIVNKYNIRSFYFTDDNFFADLKRADKIIKGIIKRKLNIKWIAQGVRIDTAKKFDSGFMKSMEESGCKRLIFGVETGSQRLLNLIDKKITVRQVIEVNRKFRKSGIYTEYNFMCGFPTETKEDKQKTIDLCFRLMRENKNALLSGYWIYTPYPKTELINLCRELGLKLPEKLEDWACYNFNDARGLSWLTEKEMEKLEALNYTSLFLDKHKIIEWDISYIRIFAKIYRPFAILRIRHQFFSFMIELKMHKFLIKFFKKN